jgi:hypothetical protein
MTSHCTLVPLPLYVRYRSVYHDPNALDNGIDSTSCLVDSDAFCSSSSRFWLLCDPPFRSQSDTCFTRRNPRLDPVNRNMRNGACGLWNGMRYRDHPPTYSIDNSMVNNEPSFPDLSAPLRKIALSTEVTLSGTDTHTVYVSTGQYIRGNILTPIEQMVDI